MHFLLSRIIGSYGTVFLKHGIIMCKGDIIGKWSLICVNHESESEHGVESKDREPQ